MVCDTWYSGSVGVVTLVEYADMKVLGLEQYTGAVLCVGLEAKSMWHLIWKNGDTQSEA